MYFPQITSFLQHYRNVSSNKYSTLPLMATVANTKHFAEYFRAMSTKMNFRIQSKTVPGWGVNAEWRQGVLLGS